MRTGEPDDCESAGGGFKGATSVQLNYHIFGKHGPSPVLDVAIACMHARAHAACQTRLMKVVMQLNWLIQRCAKQSSARNLENGAMCSHARTVDSL